ncbi:hypothetical protein MP638_005748 [Amoeboaphelidium occidentale]|nr:hypothetical protein MP638_005748 [Amoeboaphelidium occidentale]
MQLSDIFAKYRKPNAGLENQKRLVALLSAVEDVIQHSNLDLTPTAYYANLLILLKNNIQNEDSTDEADMTAIVSLFSVACSHVNAPVLQNQFEETSLILMEILQKYTESSIIQRHAMDALSYMVLSQEASAWSSSSVCSIFQILLAKCSDEKPKVRKVGVSCVVRILSHPPPPPLVHHPAEKLVVKHVCSSFKSHDNEEDLFKSFGIVREVLPYLSGSSILSLCSSISKLKLGSKNGHLLLAIYDALCELFEMINASGVEDNELLVDTLENILERRPDINDSLIPSWLATVVGCLGALYVVDIKQSRNIVSRVFRTVFQLLQFTPHTQQQTKKLHEAVKLSASSIISLTYDEKMNEDAIKEIVSVLLDGLSLSYQSGWNVVMDLVGDMFVHLGSHVRTNPNAVKLSYPLIEKLSDDEVYGDNEHFAGMEEFTRAIGSAISAVGAKEFVKIMPFGLTKTGFTRPWVVPIMKENIKDPELAFFLDFIVPLSQSLAERGKELLSLKSTEMEGKLCAIVWSQLWGLFSSFCNAPLDAQECLPQLFEVVIPLIGSNLNLLPDICKGLRILLTSLESYKDAESISDETVMTSEIARDSIGVLSSKATDILPHLFTKYVDLCLSEVSQVKQDLPLSMIQMKTCVLECINAWMRVAPDSDLNAFFQATLRQFLALQPDATQGAENNEFMAKKQSLLDLASAILLSKRLGVESLAVLAKMSIKGIGEAEGNMQKKCYRILNRILLIDDEKAKASFLENESFMTPLLEEIVSVSEKVHVSSKKERFAMMKLLINNLNWRRKSDCSFIPAALSEVVLGTKENSEKARVESYECLVSISKFVVKAEKESQGTCELIMSEEGEEPIMFKASLMELFNMILAGLAARTPQMISATIHALSRLLYEFRTSSEKDDIPDEMLEVMIQTVLAYAINCKNREIIKACVGFIKVVLKACPEIVEKNSDVPFKPESDEDGGDEMMSDTEFGYMSAIIFACLRWTNEHKSHFKLACRYILERMVKKYGLDRVVKFIPQEHSKLVSNIRKRKERSEKKKVQFKENESNASKSFDELMMDEEEERDSQDEDINDEEELPELFKQLNNSRSKKTKEGVHIKAESDDEDPLDFMSKSVAKNVIHSGSSSLKRDSINSKSKKSTAFKTDRSGKLIIEDEDTLMAGTLDEEDEAGDTYMEMMKSKDAYTRSADGKRIKFSQKRKAESDDEEVEATATNKKRKQKTKKLSHIEMKKRGIQHTGKDFRSKKAKGDVKKDGSLDPFAYIPLNPKSIAKKAGKRGIVVDKKAVNV